MPFTLSHPAAVLPVHWLLRRRLPFAALVAGSVSPDIPYYFTPGKYAYLSDNAHTFARSFTYCVPAAFCLLLLLRALLPAFLRLLPGNLGQLFTAWLREPLGFRTPLALLLGAWTHIAWDDATHRTGRTVAALPFLREEIFGFELFRVLQHFSTLAGALLLCWFVRRECLRLGRPLAWEWHWKWAAWGGAGLAALAFTALTFTSDWNYALTANDRRLAFLFVISLVRNTCVALAFTAVTVSLLQRKSVE